MKFTWLTLLALLVSSSTVYADDSEARLHALAEVAKAKGTVLSISDMLEVAEQEAANRPQAPMPDHGPRTVMTIEEMIQHVEGDRPLPYQQTE